MKEPKKLNGLKPINKHPGRVVCICTAKGKIVYLEDTFNHNKNDRR